MKSPAILIIDDESAIRSGVRLSLVDEGWSVDTSATGTDGLNQALTGAYDVILLDIKLPDISGMEILKTLRLQQPDVYVIMMTGFATVPNAVKALKIGAYNYIAKPFSSDEIILAVKKALENKHLKEDNLSLRKQLYQRYDFNQIVGEHPLIKNVFEAIKRVAPTDSTVLLDGESGTGKELFAGSIHAHSLRASRQFIVADCSTFSASLLESELFGHVKGAFTGAVQNKAGIFEAADGGTLFLDEVANLNMEIQGKLLRVMETLEYKPVGASHTRKSDVRIIAATNQNLKTLVKEGTFRQDLFYRMNVFPIFLPPLRERKEDIPRLVYHFLRFFCRKTGKTIDGFSDEALDKMLDYSWPGNVRQLKNVVERLVIMTDQTVVDSGSLLNHFENHRNQGKDSVPSTLEELKSVKRHLLEKQFARIEKSFLQKALDAENGNITRASERVGMQRSNFSALMKKHNISNLSREK
ncbi:MAG: sigma-54 dependent transcriptional regulator [Desulfobacteraceae bacterium]|jgi:DNA-binding NtrC family response regulator|nr:sigma-54 dependent transcriptional regulator [Desulfobacteraceae bacterium]